MYPAWIVALTASKQLTAWSDSCQNSRFLRFCKLEFSGNPYIPGSSICLYLFLPLLEEKKKRCFLRKNSVPQHKCCCELSSTWSAIFALDGIFAAAKWAWHEYIRRNAGLPKIWKVVLVEKQILAQKAEIKHAFEDAHIQIFILIQRPLTK